MGYFSCNGESSIYACNPYSWDLKKQNPDKNPFEIREFSYSEIDSATNNFSSDNFLGKGSHGSVYKAILDQGKLIAAVKKIKKPSPPSHNNCTAAAASATTTAADNEIEILSKIRNPRLVNLLGFSFSPKYEKFIIVEYMPNGTLYDLLHSDPNPPRWTRRIRFALQVAKGVNFLHLSDPPVIHRDIKSSNVLLDKKWKARLGDFGLALRGHMEDVKFRGTPPAGTLGYLDPEYLCPGDLSTKSDVFSFGILLLEIISGRNAIDVKFSPPSVLDWALPLVKKGDFDGLSDLRIGPHPDPDVMRFLGVLATKCVSSVGNKRPDMAEVVECLKYLSGIVHAPVWNNLRRRVRKIDLAAETREAVDSDSAEVLMTKISKLGGRWNRKVSSVEAGNGVIGPAGNRVSRSKSIGSLNEMVRFGSVWKKNDPTIKLPVARLSKSRSMGVLQGSNLIHCKEKKIVVKKVVKNPNAKESEKSKLLVSTKQESPKCKENIIDS